MLKQLSRLERTRSIIIIGFAFLMAVSLIVFYAPGRTSGVPTTNSTEVIARVGRDDITVGELARLKENYMAMFGGRVSMAQLGGNKRFLEGLIRDRVIAQEAERLGLSASDAEVAEEIRKQFKDASGQFVGIDRYKESVVARYGDVESFERSVRNDIARRKLRAFVTSSVTVSDEEVQREYERTNTSFDLTYTILTIPKLAEKIQATDDELKAYYEQNKIQYRYFEPQKKVRYLFVNQEKSGQKQQISDNELKAEFDQLRPDAKQAGVKVQQILLKVARKSLDAEVEQKAKDLIAKATAAPPDKAEQVFSDLARGNSEDPATAKNGGYLLRPVKRDPNKIHGLYDRTLDMTPGQISDIPIRYAGNWYVLRRGDAVQKTFEEAKPELLVSLRNRKGYEVAKGIADRARARLVETKDVQKVAQEFAAEANMSPAEMVRETPYVKPGDDVPEIGSSQQFEAALEPLNNAGDVGERTGIKNGFAVPMLVDKKEPRIPEFDEVKTKVTEAYKQQRAREQIEQKAKDLAASISSATDLKAAAEKAGFEVETEEAYKIGGSLGETQPSPALDETIYALKEGEVTKVPVKLGGDSFVVVGVTKREGADLAAFGSQRSQLTETMVSSKQNQVFEDYVAAVQQKMKQDGNIKIYQDVLASVEAAEPEIAAPQLPQLPLQR